VDAAVREGLGVGILSRTLVEKDLASGGLIKICELSDERLGYYLIPVSANPSQKLRLLMKWLHKKAAEAP